MVARGICGLIFAYRRVRTIRIENSKFGTDKFVRVIRSECFFLSGPWCPDSAIISCEDSCIDIDDLK